MVIINRGRAAVTRIIAVIQSVYSESAHLHGCDSAVFVPWIASTQQGSSRF